MVSSSASATDVTGDFGQVRALLWASVSLSVCGAVPDTLSPCPSRLLFPRWKRCLTGSDRIRSLSYELVGVSRPRAPSTPGSSGLRGSPSFLSPGTPPSGTGQSVIFPTPHYFLSHPPPPRACSEPQAQEVASSDNSTTPSPFFICSSFPV